MRADPNYANAWMWRGNTRSYLGDAERAIEDLQQALRLSPLDATFGSRRPGWRTPISCAAGMKRLCPGFDGPAPASELVECAARRDGGECPGGTSRYGAAIGGPLSRTRSRCTIDENAGMVVVPRRRGCREIPQRLPPGRNARMNRWEGRPWQSWISRQVRTRFLPEWLTAALQNGGPRNANVASFDYEPIAAGVDFLGKLGRLRLRYAGGHRGPLPQTLVVKTGDPGREIATASPRCSASTSARSPSTATSDPHAGFGFQRCVIGAAEPAKAATS